MADVTEAVEFLRQANDAESQMRNLGLRDLRFRMGEQWPDYAIASRGLDRPKLTINELDSYIRQVTNNQRQQRPRIKVSPVDNYADPKIAKIITGLTRHIEVNSDADNAYDTAFDFAATIGWGYWRLRTDYISENSFNQDIFIDVVENPFTVYFDPSSKLPDGSDSEKALVTDMMTKDAFNKLYPGAQDSGFTERGTGDSDPDWSTEHEIRLAEYFYVERKRAKLLMLSDGNALWEDEFERHRNLILSAGVSVQADRDSFRREVRWCKQTIGEILEEKTLPGRWIPIVPVYWTRVRVDSQWDVRGIVRDATDPQIMLNFWHTAATESIALAPKAKWVMAEGQNEGYENEWANANLAPNPVLTYKQTDVDGKDAPAPQRVQPEPPPAGILSLLAGADNALQKVVGIFDPAVRSQEPKSGKAIQAEKMQSEMSNFHGYDNLTRSIKHTGRIILSWVPTVYDTERVLRIIGVDGRENLVTVNQKMMDQVQNVEKVLNDLTVGTYDVVMETGPGYDTKRQEGVASMLELMRTPIGEQVAKVGPDLLVRQMDFNESDVLADRLAAMNPLAKDDDGQEMQPEQMKMMLKGLQMQLQQAQQQLQAAGIEIKFGLQKEAMKQAGETRREAMRQAGDAEERRITRAQKQHDTEVYALTAQNVAEINGLVRILTSNTDKAHDLRKMLATFEHETTMNDREQAGKAAATEPVV